MKREHRKCAHFWNFGGICITIVMKRVLRNLRPKHCTLLLFLLSFNVTQQFCDRVNLEEPSNLNSYHWTIAPHLEELEGQQMCTENVQGKVSKSFRACPGIATCWGSASILQATLLLHHWANSPALTAEGVLSCYFSSFSSMEKHSQRTSLKTLEHLNISVKEKMLVSNNTLPQRVIYVCVTLTCIRNLRNLFTVMLLIFPGGREQTGSSAFRNCFKLGRVYGRSCIVLQVGKAPLKEAVALFSDFVPAAVNLFHCPWLMRLPFLFLVSFSLSFPFMS